MTYRSIKHSCINAVMLATIAFGCESSAPHAKVLASEPTPGPVALTTPPGETAQPKPEASHVELRGTASSAPPPANSQVAQPGGLVPLTPTETSPGVSNTGLLPPARGLPKTNRVESEVAAGSTKTSSARAQPNTPAQPSSAVESSAAGAAGTLISQPSTSRPKAALVTGPAVTGEGYRTYLQMPSPVSVGTSATVTVHLEPQPPFKSNAKYPFRFVVGPVRGATAPTSPVTVAAVAPTRTTLQFPITAAEPGRTSVSGTFSFSVCTEEKCLVERAPLVLSFEVTADAVSAGPHP